MRNLMEKGKPVNEPCKLRDRNNAFEMYELYINRHFKEGDWYWSRFKIYLSLNTGIVAVEGILLKDFLKDLPFNAPIFLWIISSVLFFVGIYLAKVWQKVAADGHRWQLIIVRRISELEPQLFEEGVGLYTAIRREYEETNVRKAKEEDVTDINIRLARFFFCLWVIALGASVLFLVLTLISRILLCVVKFV